MSAFPQFDQLCRVIAAMEADEIAHFHTLADALGPDAARDWAGHAAEVAKLAHEIAYLCQPRQGQREATEYDLDAYERDGKEAARRLGKPYLGAVWIGPDAEMPPPEDRPQVHVYALRAGFLG
jgi:hypothetical protein